MNITLKEIAEEAGVSTMTVSNVINRKNAKVSQETKERILEIIKKHNYSPNMNARALSSKHSKLIGVLYFSQNEVLDFSNPFVAEVLSGIEKKARAFGYFILVNHFKEPEDLILLQSNWNFDGFIIIGLMSDKFELFNQNIKIPTVYVDTILQNDTLKRTFEQRKDVYFILTHDRKLARKATQHQLELGHTKIGFLTYDIDMNVPSVIIERYKGYQDMMGDLPVHLIPYKEGTNISLLYDKIKDYTALVVTADILAADVAFMLKERKKSISLVGFDDIKISKYMSPSLSTIRIDQTKKGELALEKIGNQLKKEAKESDIIFLDGELIVRESSFKVIGDEQF